MKNILADITIAPSGGFSGIGTLGKPSDPGQGGAFYDFSKIMSMAIGVLTLVAFIWFLFVLITGAIGVMNSGGDQKALESSKKRITNGLVGLVVVIASIFIVDLIGVIIGVDYLNVFYLFNCIAGNVVGGC